MKVLSLFSGAGGGDLASQHLLGWKGVGYVEINEYCQKIIAQRIKDGFVDRAPTFGDIRAFISEGYAASYQGMVDVITAGFPCQPFSLEGKRNWNTSLTNLWPETERVISIVRPECVLLENVPGIREYLPVVIRDLRRLGYHVKRPLTISAADTGALHIRKRVWVLAHANSARRFWKRDGFCPPARKGMQTWAEFEGLVQNVLQSCVPSRGGRGIHDGVPYRLDRLKATGNAQLPAMAATAWNILTAS